MNQTIYIPLARIHFRFRVETPIWLADWPASMLRGAFGSALRRLSCMTRQKECSDCPLWRTCPYPEIFEPPPVRHRLQRFSQPPAPYIVEPESRGPRMLEKGEPLRFGMALMGRALAEMPLVVESVKNAARRGLGKNGGTAELIEVTLSPGAPDGAPQTLYRPAEDKRLREFTPPILAAPAPPPALPRLTLRFHTPLRLQNDGRALAAANLAPETFLIAAARRIALLAELYGNGPPPWDFKELVHRATGIAGAKSLRWRDWTRYSSRQRQHMALGGAVGDWRLSGEL
ncbi:MAG: hypothetical protein LBS70_09565, partial [Candidatus Accumulibacter sp.]|nr:hypothetical protein [Accumulibacter sp.]